MRGSFLDRRLDWQRQLGVWDAQITATFVVEEDIVRRIVCVLLVSAVLAFCATLALADDILPPPWTRGGDRTTYQDWTFATNTNPTGPDLGIANPYGVPTATIVGGTWSQYYDNHVGAWYLGTLGYIDAPIANAPDHPEWTKKMWIQLTWQGATPVVLVDGLTQQVYETDLLPDTNWYHSTWLCTLPYNPPMETLHITGNTYVGEVVVDTICVPEPSSLLALAGSVLGMAGLAWKRRR